MFGYITTDLPNLYVKDVALYKATYCGLCKSIGKTCGEKGRFLLNYDLTFLSLFLHNVRGEDLDVKKEHCIIHHLKKRPVAKVDELSKRIGTLNVILGYYKLKDNISDENKSKALALFFKSSYKRAKKQEPKLEEIVNKNYADLQEKEKKNLDSIDIVCDSFGNMIKEIVNELLDNNASEEINNLSYNLGKWIYLIDALDDFDKDKRKKSFNVLVNSYPDILDKQSLIKEKGKELLEIFGFTINEIVEANKKIKYNFNHDLTDNILNKGIIQKTKNIMESKKCKNTTTF
ncbi:MAG: DUF5685 family protein [Clostridia bacterium]|nr:DUF5685 family protein [Clostridia bacterium]